MHNKERKFAFSLAEALVTLLIVCLITIASIPILTKKKRDMSREEHGMFACYWNENNQLVAKYSRKGAVSNGTTKYDNVENRMGCVFNPPSDAKNFVVTIVGGGGGGAAATYERYKEIFGTGDNNFEIKATGNYDALLIGGGGGGGGSKGGCSNPDCGGGGSSAAIAGFRNQKFNVGDVLNITVGGGGAGDNGDRVMGHNGNESRLSFLRNGVEKQLVVAGGGGGGFGYGARVGGKGKNWNGLIYTGASSYLAESAMGQYMNIAFAYNSKYPENKVSNYSNVERVYSEHGGEAVLSNIDGQSFYSHGTRRSKSYSYTNCSRGSGGRDTYCVNKAYDTYVNEFGIDSDRSSLYGGGGNGDLDGNKGPNSGKSGVGVVKWIQSYSGRGGKAGSVLQLPFAQLPPNTLAFPGQGGRGGVVSRSSSSNPLRRREQAGKPGQSSYLKNYAEVLAGQGADYIRTGSESSYNETKASGEYSKGGNGELANINPVEKVIGGAGGYTFVSENGYIDNAGLAGHTRPIFKNGVEISEFKNLVGAGAGGGGGAANGRDRGNGGNGSSGIVFIQW